jgi:hypothetical protein
MRKILPARMPSSAIPAFGTRCGRAKIHDRLVEAAAIITNEAVIMECLESK